MTNGNEKQFQLAKTLRESKVSYRQIAKIVSNAFNRTPPYSPTTMNVWCKFNTYEEYRLAQIKRIEDRKEKKPVEKTSLNDTNSIIAVLKAIEYQQQQTNAFLKELTEKKKGIFG